ncbi:MAG: hypothetical protein E7338_02100 [Clostridiales bacterium]|nr:hypothetical protein [Clostridiales bacterium]
MKKVITISIVLLIAVSMLFAVACSSGKSNYNNDANIQTNDNSNNDANSQTNDNSNNDNDDVEYYTLTINNNTANNSIAIQSGAINILSQDSFSKEYNSEVFLRSVGVPVGSNIIWTRSDGETFTGSTYSFKMPKYDLSISVILLVEQHKLIVNNQASADGISLLNSIDDSYDYNENVILEANNVPAGYSIKWIRSDGVTEYGNTYCFSMPAVDVTITMEKYKLYEYDSLDSNIIYYGRYPQELVENTSIINALQSKSGQNTISFDSSVWNRCTNDSNMWYQDYYLNGEKYRGIYYSKDNQYRTNNGFSKNTFYWFKWAPVKWEVLNVSDGKALLISSIVLDAQVFYSAKTSGVFTHNGGSGYANNYELSDIRIWLAESFCAEVFVDAEESILQATMIDNSSASYGGSPSYYECNSCYDKLFLLSYSEVNTYFELKSTQTVSTSYAKCQGLIKYSSEYSDWRLRSPDRDTTGDNSNKYIGADGNIYGTSALSSTGKKTNTLGGIRPACWINL